MKITVGKLRRLIVEAAVSQAKLGLAGAHGSTRSNFDDKDDVHSRDERSPLLTRPMSVNFEPDEETRETWRQYVQRSAKAGMEEPWGENLDNWFSDDDDLGDPESMPEPHAEADPFADPHTSRSRNKF